MVFPSHRRRDDAHHAHRSQVGHAAGLRARALTDRIDPPIDKWIRQRQQHQRRCGRQRDVVHPGHKRRIDIRVIRHVFAVEDRPVQQTEHRLVGVVRLRLAAEAGEHAQVVQVVADAERRHGRRAPDCQRHQPRNQGAPAPPQRRPQQQQAELRLHHRH